MKINNQTEGVGVFYVLLSALVAGIFPLLVNLGLKNIPPLFFAGITTLLASLVSFIYAALLGKLPEIFFRKSYSSILMVTLCIVVIPYILFFIGAGKTSGLNSSLLLLSEIIFIVLFTPFIGERTTTKKILGGLGIFIGTIIILYNGGFAFNLGDFLIAISTVTFPFSNFYLKKALNHVSTSIVLFARFLLGGIFLMLLSLIFEKDTNQTMIINEYWGIIAFTGFVVLGVGKIFLYEGFKRLDISKGSSLALTFPIFSMLFLMFFFDEQPTLIQWIGFGIMLIGIYFTVKRKSVDPSITKYTAKK